MVCSVHRICITHLCRLTIIYHQYKQYTRRTAAKSNLHAINNNIWQLFQTFQHLMDMTCLWKTYERYKLYLLYRHICALVDAPMNFTSQTIHHMTITMVHESIVECTVTIFVFVTVQSLYFVSLSCQITSALGRNHWSHPFKESGSMKLERFNRGTR